MADKQKRIIDLPAALLVSGNDIFTIVQDEISTKIATTNQIGEAITTSQSFSQLETISKNIIGAINEINAGSGGAGSLEELSDVTITSATLSDGQVLRYDIGTQSWINANPSGGSLENLTDVTITALSLSNGQFLVYDNLSDKWINKEVIHEPITQAQYDAMVQAGMVDPNVYYPITDASIKTSELDNDSGFASIDDNSTANNKAWSASKIISDNYRPIKVNGATKLSSDSSSGAINLINSSHIKLQFTPEGSTLSFETSGIATIDDTTKGADKTYSSNKVSSLVDNVKTETEVINQNIMHMLYNTSLNDGNVGFKRGSVNLLTGEYIASAKKAMVDVNFEPIELKSNTTLIHIATGYKTRGVLLNPDKTFNSYFTAWSTGGTVDALQNKKGYFAMLYIEKVDGTDLTDLEVSSANEKTLYIESVLGFENGILGELAKINKPFYNKKIVNFGDSLFGNFRDDDETTHKSISKMISENTGAITYNAGFGGCRMGERLYGASYWNAFSMYALADSVYSGDWSVQDQALVDGSGTLPDYFSDVVTMLKAIDFSTIDIVTISYGTNDFTGDIPLDNTVTEYQNYEGALKYSIRKLLAKYPSLRIIVLSPAWRFWRTDGDYAYSSDDAQSANSNGDMLTDYVDKCSDVCKEYHIPYVDMYYNLGFNQYSYSAYFSDVDSTHPIQVGRWLMADRISGQLIALLCNG